MASVSEASTSLIRRCLRKAIEQRARLRGTRFSCSALSGESGYNISINADLSVSCNCQDYDGQGQLGNLRESSFAEIFAGPVASSLRASLAAGRLPLATCARCAELRRASPGEARRRVSEYSLPARGVMVENTVLCNLRCRGCYRQTVAKVRKRHAMSLEDVALVARTLRDHEIQSVSFFNLGEPFLSRTVFEELRLIRELNPRIRIGVSTNGVLLDSDAKREAALLCDAITFSLDGASQESAEAYQVGTDFERAVGNLKALVAARDARGLTGPTVTWKYVLFNWNDRPELVRKAVALARDAGADEFLVWPTFRPLWGSSWRYFLLPGLRRLGERVGRLPPGAYTRVPLRSRPATAP